MKLSFFTIFLKFFKAIFKQYRTVCWKAVLVEKVWMFFISTMIFLPCAIKADTVEQPEIDSIFVDGNFENREVLNKCPMQYVPPYVIKGFWVNG